MTLSKQQCMLKPPKCCYLLSLHDKKAFVIKNIATSFPLSSYWNLQLIYASYCLRSIELTRSLHHAWFHINRLSPFYVSSIISYPHQIFQIKKLYVHPSYRFHVKKGTLSYLKIIIFSLNLSVQELTISHTAMQILCSY